MKKTLCLLALLVFVTGCNIEKIQYVSYEDTVHKVLSYETNLHNVSLDGYSYYLPMGAKLEEKNEMNSVIRYNGMKFYLYVDVISYYHKVNNTFEVSADSYYSKKLEHNSKFGYLEITKIKDRYFVEFMYHYAKIEAYVEEGKMHDAIYQMTLILSSISYHDAILESLIGENALNYSEEQFDILNPKKGQGADNSLDFDYDQMYEDYDGTITDEDSIEIIDDEERQHGTFRQIKKYFF